MEGRETETPAPAGQPAPTAPAAEVRRCRLPAVARSVGAARRWIAESPLGGPSLRNAQLVLSELVTNCIVHAGLDEERDEIELTVSPTPTGVRVEVVDPGSGFDPPTPGAVGAGPLAGGHGFSIVDRLADRWGVERDAATRVWFEMDRR